MQWVVMMVVVDAGACDALGHRPPSTCTCGEGCVGSEKFLNLSGRRCWSRVACCSEGFLRACRWFVRTPGSPPLPLSALAKTAVLRCCSRLNGAVSVSRTVSADADAKQVHLHVVGVEESPRIRRNDRWMREGCSVRMPTGCSGEDSGGRWRLCTWVEFREAQLLRVPPPAAWNDMSGP